MRTERKKEPEAKPPRALIYVRTSTANGANGDSRAAQEEACRSWAAANGHEIAGEPFRDNGLSGALTADERPGLAAALAALDAGEAEGLLVHRLDRLAREIHAQEAALGKAWEAGARVYEAVRGEVLRDDPDDPMRKFVRRVMGEVAELEREMVRARLRLGRHRKRLRGGYSGGPSIPFGYRVEGSGPEAHFVPEPETHPTVGSIVALRESGATLAAIATDLNAAGIPGARGGKWHPSSVSRVLRREEERTSWGEPK